MNTNSRKTTWIAILCTAAFAVAYVYLVFLPNQRVMRERAAQIQQRQDYVIASGSLAAVIHATRAELERTDRYNATCSTLTPPEGQLADVLGQIDALVVASGSLPTRFDPEPAVNMAKLGRVPVVVGCTGTFAQVSQLLYDIDSLAEAVWIDRVQIEETGKDGGNVRCEVNLTVFADNLDKSDQAKIAEQPIREETGFQRRLSASVR